MKGSTRVLAELHPRPRWSGGSRITGCCRPDWDQGGRATSSQRKAISSPAACLSDLFRLPQGGIVELTYPDFAEVLQARLSADLEAETIARVHRDGMGARLGAARTKRGSRSTQAEVRRLWFAGGREPDHHRLRGLRSTAIRTCRSQPSSISGRMAALSPVDDVQEQRLGSGRQPGQPR